MGIGNGIGVRWGKVAMASGPVVNEAFEFTVHTDNAGTSASNQFTIPITSLPKLRFSTYLKCLQHQPSNNGLLIKLRG